MVRQTVVCAYRKGSILPVELFDLCLQSQAHKPDWILMSQSAKCGVRFSQPISIRFLGANQYRTTPQKVLQAIHPGHIVT